MKTGVTYLMTAISFVITSCVFIPKPVSKPSVKRTVYQEVDLEGMIRRNIAKTVSEVATIEGIYTVSCVITKKGETMLNPSGKEKTITRKDNYARVAIVRDWPDSNTEYVEISLSEKNVLRYPIVAEINSLSEGGGFIYKHIEPKGETLTFTFLYDQEKPDILEGVYTVTKNNQHVMYKLTYVKVYPKNNNLSSDRAF
jgi:hypothetical protein